MTFAQFLLANTSLLILLAVLVIAWLMVYGFDRAGGLKVISPQEAVIWANQNKSQIIDIRSKDDFQQGHIARARHLEFANNKPDLSKHKKEHVLIVDDNGWQARKVARYFKSQGFPEVAIIDGGLKAWRRDNLPLIKD